MKQVLTSFAVVSTGEGKRLSYTYSVIEENGDLRQSNLRKSFIALEPDTLAHIAALEQTVAERMSAG